MNNESKKRLGGAAAIAVMVAAVTLAVVPAQSQTIDSPDAAWSYYVKPGTGPYEVLPGTYYHRFHLTEGLILQANLQECGIHVYGPQFTPFWGAVAPGMNESEIEANTRAFQMGPCSNGTLFPTQAQPVPQLLILPARGIEAANATEQAYVRADGEAVWGKHSYKAVKSEDVDVVLRVNLTRDANPPGMNSTFVSFNLASPVVAILYQAPAWKTGMGALWATAVGAAAFLLVFLVWRKP